jgi:membrane protein DedA with SNARE-associated domain
MRPVPLVVAGLALAVVAFRWARLPRQNRALGLTLVIALAGYGTGVVHLPNLEHVSRQVGEALGPYTYLLVGVLAFLETGAGIGLIAPGELAVVIGGVAAGQGHIQIALLILLVWGCAFAGDTASFLLGRRLGRDFLLKHGPRVKLTRERIEQVERYFASHGGKTILIGRFIGLVRALAPFVAGASKMAPRRFIPYSFLAAGVWSATFSILGYVFWQSFDQAVAIAKQGTLGLGALVGFILAAIWTYRTLREHKRPAKLLKWLDQRAFRRVRGAVTKRAIWRCNRRGKRGPELTGSPKLERLEADRASSDV